MDKEHLDRWMKFLGGHWTTEMPQKPGQYFLATLQGELTGDMAVVYEESRGSGVIKSARSWGGYWWSEPTPNLPRPVAMNKDG